MCYCSKNHQKGSEIRRNAILDLIRSNPSITIPEIAIIQKFLLAQLKEIWIG